MLNLSEMNRIMRDIGYLNHNDKPYHDTDVYIKGDGMGTRTVIVHDNRRGTIQTRDNARSLIDSVKKSDSTKGSRGYLLILLDDGKNFSLSHMSDVVHIRKWDLVWHQSLSVPEMFKEDIRQLKSIMKKEQVEDQFYKYKTGISAYGASKKVVATYILALICAVAYWKRLDVAKYGLNVFVEGTGEYHRTFTYMFLHSTILHLVANLFSLICVGHVIEKRIGWANTTFIFILSGIFGAAASLQYGSTLGMYSITIGASGAICGLIGATIVEGLDQTEDVRMPFVMHYLFWFAMILLIGFLAPNIDNMCHIGGFIGGIVADVMIILGRSYIRSSTIVEAQERKLFSRY